MLYTYYFTAYISVQLLIKELCLRNECIITINKVNALSNMTLSLARVCVHLNMGTFGMDQRNHVTINMRYYFTITTI